MAVGLENGNILIFAAEALDTWELIQDLGLASSHTGTVTRLRFQPLANDPPAETAPLLVRLPFYLKKGACNGECTKARKPHAHTLGPPFPTFAARFLRHRRLCPDP